MRTALRVLSSVLLIDCSVPDARAGSPEEDAAEPRVTFVRVIAPSLGSSAPEPPLIRVDCNIQRKRECVRFCVGEYAAAAAAKRCIRACTQYCTTCSADRRRQCRAN